MNFIGLVMQRLKRSSPGSAETAAQVLSRLPAVTAENILFMGDETDTPQLILKKYGGSLTAAFTDEIHCERGKKLGLDCSVVQLYELPGEDSFYDLIWYNGFVEFDGCAQRLELLKRKLKKGGILVYRAVSWLTEPSPDTELFCERRFGKIYPLDKVLITAKENGWQPLDFYIAPKTDWTAEFYEPLTAAAREYAEIHSEDSSVSHSMHELAREVGIFEAHCEEYSSVYYILKG